MQDFIEYCWPRFQVLDDHTYLERCYTNTVPLELHRKCIVTRSGLHLPFKSQIKLLFIKQATSARIPSFSSYQLYNRSPTSKEKNKRATG